MGGVVQMFAAGSDYIVRIAQGKQVAALQERGPVAFVQDKVQRVGDQDDSHAPVPKVGERLDAFLLKVGSRWARTEKARRMTMPEE